ncbi:MAG: FAD-binding protein, partial [Planctomycetes bacterium]|nr:FAD-binding protein [Planctomycetota bacterium]
MAQKTTDRHHDTTMIADLARELARQVDGEVHFDPATQAMYSYDASHYRHVPIGYVAPRNVGALEAAVAVCRRHDAAVLMRGGGTSLAGQGCNRAVVIDTTRHLHRLLALDPAGRTARLEPGIVLDDLQAAARPHGLCFGPDPSTHGWCTLGGMIANNAAGAHSLMAGKTVDNVHALRVLTYDGHTLDAGPTDEPTLERLSGRPDRVSTIYGALRALRDRYAGLIRKRYPQIPRRVSGYNLDELLPERGFDLARALVGTEGTCAIVTEATVRLVPTPPHRVLVILGYPSLGAAGDAVPRLLEYTPIALEGMGRRIIDNMRAKGLEATGLELLPPGEAWLFVELGGDRPDEAAGRAHELTGDIAGRPGGAPHVVLADPAQAQHIWLAREAGLGASGRLADGRDTEAGWEDAAV